MTDDELIEAMTLAYDEEDNYGNLSGAMKAALAVARPIIECETRERCARIAEEMTLCGDIAAAIRNQSND